ncbi:MAG TPA: glycosyltransferase family 4 protein [Terracidiphilus sp.]|nr:glycosyltransferase family 4 protein [Terracidiphilus sp.]
MEERLRVGFASVEDAASVRSWSGIPAHVLAMLRETPGVEVEVISPLGQRLKWLYGPMLWNAKRAGEHFDWKREAWSLRHFAAEIERKFRAKKLDVIFSTSSIPGTRVRPEVPVVFWTDANFHVMRGYYRSNHSAHTERATRLQDEAALRGARFACYASDWAAAEARKLTEPERVKVLPLGPNLPLEHSGADVEQWIRERVRHTAKSCTLLFVGVEWERKGGAIAVETARRLNEAGIATTLKFVGCTPPVPVPPFVELLGFINKRDPEGYRKLVELYRTSDLFLLPSRAEAFGVVVAEAAAFGLPALVCRTGGLTETVRNGETGFLLPLEDDGRLFAERAQAVLRDYERFAKNAYAEFAGRMNWRTSVDRLTELLREAAGKKTRRG